MVIDATATPLSTDRERFYICVERLGGPRLTEEGYGTTKVGQFEKRPQLCIRSVPLEYAPAGMILTRLTGARGDRRGGRLS